MEAIFQMFDIYQKEKNWRWLKEQEMKSWGDFKDASRYP